MLVFLTLRQKSLFSAIALAIASGSALIIIARASSWVTTSISSFTLSPREVDFGKGFSIIFGNLLLDIVKFSGIYLYSLKTSFFGIKPISIQPSASCSALSPGWVGSVKPIKKEVNRQLIAYN
jgi:hypothetical protein